MITPEKSIAFELTVPLEKSIALEPSTRVLGGKIVVENHETTKQLVEVRCDLGTLSFAGVTGFSDLRLTSMVQGGDISFQPAPDADWVYAIVGLPEGDLTGDGFVDGADIGAALESWDTGSGALVGDVLAGWGARAELLCRASIGMAGAGQMTARVIPFAGGIRQSPPVRAQLVLRGMLGARCQVAFTVQAKVIP